jgi:hypothetical protein
VFYLTLVVFTFAKTFKIMNKKFVLFLFTFLLVNCIAFAKKDNLTVFYDCSNFGGNCFYDFVRQENNLVTFVRDRLDADVHVLVKSNRNSIGTNIVTYFMVGRNEYANMQDTLNFTLPLTSTDDDNRKILVQQLQIGLLPYLAKTTLPEKMVMSLKKNANSIETDSVIIKKDLFNYWVFQIGGNGNISGSQNYKDIYANGYVFADRETDKTKTNIYVNADEQFSSYVDNSGTLEFEFQSFGAGADHIKKLNEHWGVGGGVSFNNSLFSNLLTQFAAGPKVEFSIFPYRIFNNKRWVLGYELEGRINNYYDSTIYFKKQDAFMAQNINSIFSYTQPWGSINAGVFWRNFLHDFSKNNLSLSGAFTTRITKGLNFAIWGNYNFVRNQINIRKGNATTEELLVKNRELLSGFNFMGGVGISYRFGSKYNDAVNPAFKGMSYNISL